MTFEYEYTTFTMYKCVRVCVCGCVCVCVEYERIKQESDLGKGSTKASSSKHPRQEMNGENRSPRGKKPPLVGRRRNRMNDNRKEKLEKFVRVLLPSKIRAGEGGTIFKEPPLFPLPPPPPTPLYIYIHTHTHVHTRTTVV